MKIFLAITAIMSWLFGIMMLFFAKDLYAPMAFILLNNSTSSRRRKAPD
jgi:hypothetical protein